VASSHEQNSYLGLYVEKESSMVWENVLYVRPMMNHSAHMLIDYSYAMSIWKDVELLIGLRNVWGG
jgi:hypothetical protein